MKTLTLIEEPSEENLAEAEDEFERLLNESSQLMNIDDYQHSLIILMHFVANLDFYET